MITVVISNNRTREDLYCTLKSIANTAAQSNAIEIKIADFSGVGEKPDLSAFSKYNIEVIEAKKKKMSVLFECAKKAAGEYIIFANSGDIFSRFFFKIIGGIKEKSDIIVVNAELLPDYSGLNKELRKAKRFPGKSDTIIVDLVREPQLVPTETTGVLFNTKALNRVGIDTNLELDGLKYSMLKILNETESFVQVNNLLLASPYPTVEDKVNFPEMHNPKWYFESVENFILPMLKSIKDGERTKPFIQYEALYEIKWRYTYNLDGNNKHITDNEFERFISNCRELLSLIENSILFNCENSPRFRMRRGLQLALFNTKYGVDTESEYLFEKNNIVRKYDNIVLMKASFLRVILELVEYENGRLIFEASVDDFMDMSKCELKCYLDNTEIEITETYRYAHTKYFGVSTNKRYTFRFEIPDEMITAEKQIINFFICCNGFSLAVPFTTRRYTSKISSSVYMSYWKFGDNGNALCLENSNKDLVLTKICGFNRFKREIKMLGGMLLGSRRSYSMFLLRAAYWLTRPYFRNKRIWLTYDKLYKGGDCGEYFYRYMLSQKKCDGITPAYVINRDCDDAKRLRKEGLKPLYFGTLKNKLYYLNAEAVFATHGGVHSFNGLANSYVKYVQDLIYADVTCIQHGLSVQQLAQELNRVFNNTKRYYCASKYEIKNLEHPIYGYEDKSALRLTGIPRYDGLVSNDQKQILITPTWRAYISMPPVMGQSRPYYPEFKNTNYYKIYYNLLTDEKLIQTARRTGYKLIYLLHPIISSQIVDYPDIDGVEIIPATTVNYEKILTESSLMLTDYSGVQFDFAYMRKPVVYYHPPKLPPHYKEGGFFYDSMGFGEICTEHEEMVNCLCDYMENNCEMKPFYKDRADDFFAYSDLNSCKRIYDDMKEYIENKGK